MTGQTLTSTHLPAVRIKFDKAFKYVGNQTFVLYDVANAEQHFFVDADKEGRIKRMYWVQFEGYLPNNTHAYDYKANKTVDVGGFNFVADAQARNISANQGRADSDGNRARAFLEAKGFRMASDEVLWQRLVHLVDETKRNELMIIYLEDLSGMGLTAANLAKGGAAADRWDEVSKGLLDRAIRGMKLSPRGTHSIRSALSRRYIARSKYEKKLALGLHESRAKRCCLSAPTSSYHLHEIKTQKYDRADKS